MKDKVIGSQACRNVYLSLSMFEISHLSPVVIVVIIIVIV